MCKCSELTEWLKGELSHLEELHTKAASTELKSLLSAKIDAFSVVLSGLEE